MKEAVNPLPSQREQVGPGHRCETRLSRESQGGLSAALPAALCGCRPASVATPRVQALVISIPGSATNTTCLTMNQSTNATGR